MPVLRNRDDSLVRAGPYDLFVGAINFRYQIVFGRHVQRQFKRGLIQKNGNPERTVLSELKVGKFRVFSLSLNFNIPNIRRKSVLREVAGNTHVPVNFPAVGKSRRRASDDVYVIFIRFGRLGFSRVDKPAVIHRIRAFDRHRHPHDTAHFEGAVYRTCFQHVDHFYFRKAIFYNTALIQPSANSAARSSIELRGNQRYFCGTVGHRARIVCADRSALIADGTQVSAAVRAIRLYDDVEIFNCTRVVAEQSAVVMEINFQIGNRESVSVEYARERSVPILFP